MSARSASGALETRLIWLMVLRVVVVTALLGSAVTAEVIARPEGPVHPLYFLIALTYLLSLLYALAWPFSVSYRRASAFVQILGDLAIITGIVYFTGGIRSNFSFLYFIAIIASATILYRRGGLLAAGTASVLYGALVELLYLRIVPGYPPLEVAAGEIIPAQIVYYTIFLNVFGFFTVALLTSYLSESLRQTGQELEVASDHLADLQVFNESVVSSITSGLMTTDLQGRIHFANASAETILGLGSSRLIGRTVTDILSERANFIDRLKKMLGGRRFWRLEGACLNGRGEEIYLGMSVSYLLAKGGSESGFLFIFQDLTEIKRLEREVRLKENLTTMGEMAAVMAHEIRNPLASISGSVQVLREARGLRGESSRLMDIIVRESERLSATLNEFLAYARPPQFQPENVDLRQIVEETATLLRHSAQVRPEHEIVLKLPEQPVALFADANQMKQIAWNLALNAVQAMPKGGRLEVEVSRNGSGEVVMAFRDQGVGLRDGEFHQIFKPFTGSFERGTGLGLAIVYRIVQDYRGLIRLDSLSPHGTQVSVAFPLDRRTFE